MREKVVLPQVESIEQVDRLKPSCPPEWYRPFEDNKSGVPLMAAFAYSVTFLFRKYGLALMPSPPFGMVVASGSASLLLMCAMPFTEGKSSKPEWHFGSLAFVGLGASFNFMAMVLFWNALRDGEIVRVVPINRLSVLFVIFFSWFFFRKQEAVTFRVVAGGILSVVGAFVIVWGK